MTIFHEQQQYVTDLTRPIFEATDIDFFEYQKIMPNNTGLFLSSNTLLSYDCVEKNYQSSYIYLQNVYKETNKINMLHNIFYFFPKEHNQLVNNSIRDFGYRDIFCILEFYNDYIQSFTFASKNDNLLRFCFTNFDLLVQFKNKFFDQAKKLIQETEKHCIPLVMNDKNNNYNNYNNLDNNMILEKEKLMRKIRPSHYYINYGGSETEITAREFDVLKCLAQGRTNKETAKILGISAHTVENHQVSLRNRFKVDTRNTLIDIYLRSDLIAL